MKKTTNFFIQLSLFLLLSLLTVNGLLDSASLDVPLLATGIGGICWGDSMHMILNYDSETPFYEEVAYYGGTRFEIRRQFVGGRVDRTGEYTLMEQYPPNPNLIEILVIAPENMPHLADDFGYTYHHAYLKSSYQYAFPSILEHEAGDENIIHFSDKNEAFLFLKELINDGTPAIVGFPMHFEVVVGYDDNNVFLNNPQVSFSTKDTFSNNNFLNAWSQSGYYLQWFTKSHEKKNTDDIMWMLKEAAKRAHKNIRDYAKQTADGIIVDDYTDPESGNNVNHPKNLEATAQFRAHLSEFLNAHGYDEIAAKYEESAEKITEASTLSQNQRVSVLNQIAEIEEEAYNLFVDKLPEPTIELNEPQEIKQTQMQISWIPYTQNDFVSYEIYVSWLPGVLGKKVKIITDKTTASTGIENLERSRTYSITIKVNRQQGYGYSNQVTAQTARSPYITHLEVKEEWDNVIWINWFRSLRDDVVRFEIYVSKEPFFTPTEDKLKDMVPGDLDLVEGAACVQESGKHYLKLRTVYEDGTFSDSEEASIIIGVITKRFVEVPDPSENVCGNGNCNTYFGENYENCPQDCPVRPGHGDTEAICGDGSCVEPQETSENCPQDCSPATGYKADTETVCGDGRCISPTETPENCPQDCILGYGDDTKTVCGDGICELPETKDICCEDCGGCKGDLAIKIEKEITGEKSFFGKIIDFFKRLFGK